MTEKSRHIAVYVSNELYNKFVDAAWMQRKSASALLREIMEEYLEEFDEKESGNRITR